MENVKQILLILSLGDKRRKSSHSIAEKVRKSVLLVVFRHVTMKISKDSVCM